MSSKVLKDAINHFGRTGYISLNSDILIPKLNVQTDRLGAAGKRLQQNVFNEW